MNTIQNSNKLKLAVLGSTRGTDLLALIAAAKKNRLSADIKIVVSDKNNSGILEKAKQNNITSLFLDPQECSRTEFDDTLSALLKEHNINLVVLIGYMRILTKKFVNEWKNKIINVHPSLLPAFAGGMDVNVHAEVLKTGKKETGCTVHYVTDDLDAGPILLQKTCKVLNTDNVESLKARVQQLEGEALITVINKLSLITSSIEASS